MYNEIVTMIQHRHTPACTECGSRCNRMQFRTWLALFIMLQIWWGHGWSSERSEDLFAQETKNLSWI